MTALKLYKTYTDDPAYWMALMRSMYALDLLERSWQEYGEAIRLMCMEDCE